MKKLIITKNDILNHFNKFSLEWESNSEIELITKVNASDTALVVPKLIEELPKELANYILADLLELPDFPIKYLREIYEKGDKGCKVSICLRQDIPQEITIMCEKSTE